MGTDASWWVDVAVGACGNHFLLSDLETRARMGGVGVVRKTIIKLTSKRAGALKNCRNVMSIKVASRAHLKSVVTNVKCDHSACFRQ